jgi:hypothetical protein
LLADQDFFVAHVNGDAGIYYGQVYPSSLMASRSGGIAHDFNNLLTIIKRGHPDEGSEKIAKASEFCDDLPRYYGVH